MYDKEKTCACVIKAMGTVMTTQYYNEKEDFTNYNIEFSLVVQGHQFYSMQFSERCAGKWRLCTSVLTECCKRREWMWELVIMTKVIVHDLLPLPVCAKCYTQYHSGKIHNASSSSPYMVYNIIRVCLIRHTPASCHKWKQLMLCLSNNKIAPEPQ